jgi:SnoaL-like domain
MSLEDVEAIKQLKARYFRLLDTKQWDEWRKQFTDDCRYDGTSRPYPGPDEFVAGTRERLEDAVTIHQGHMPEIVITGARTARGIWSMFDWVEFEEARDVGRGLNRGFTGYGHYEEEYRKEADVWRISLLRLTRLRLTSIVSAPSAPIQSAYLSSRGRDWLANIQAMGSSVPG